MGHMRTHMGHMRTHMGPVSNEDRRFLFISLDGTYEDTYGTYEDTYGTYEDTYGTCLK